MRRPAATAAFAMLGYQVVGAVVAVAANYPSQFDHVGTDAGAELFSRGTALSAPVPIFLALAAAAVFALRRGWLGLVGAVVVGLIGIVFVIGSLGEAFAEPTPDVSKPVLVSSGVVGAVLSLVLVVAAALDVRRRASAARRRSRTR
jgi:uncharacterized membrane protein